MPSTSMATSESVIGINWRAENRVERPRTARMQTHPWPNPASWPGRPACQYQCRCRCAAGPVRVRDPACCGSVGPPDRSDVLENCQTAGGSDTQQDGLQDVIDLREPEPASAPLEQNRTTRQDHHRSRKPILLHLNAPKFNAIHGATPRTGEPAGPARLRVPAPVATTSTYRRSAISRELTASSCGQWRFQDRWWRETHNRVRTDVHPIGRPSTSQPACRQPWL